MIRDGITFRKSRAYGFRLLNDKDRYEDNRLASKVIGEAGEAFVRISDCELYEENGKQCYRSAGAPMIPTTHHSLTNMAYGVPYLDPTHIITPVYYIEDGVVYAGSLAKPRSEYDLVKTYYGHQTQIVKKLQASTPQEALEVWARQVTKPEGFELIGPRLKEEYKGYSYWSLELKSEEISVEMRMTFNDPTDSDSSEARWAGARYFTFSGHTNFKACGTQFSFDRTGVDDSFYGSDLDDPNSLFAKEIDRSKKAIIRKASQVQVPGLGFWITEEDRKKITEKLKKGQTHTFTPSGFGIGYVLYASRKRNRYDQEMSKQTTEFFEVSVLNAQTLDCD